MPSSTTPKMHQPHHSIVASCHDTRQLSAIQLLEQSLRRRQTIAALYDLGDLAPSDAAAIEPHAEPSARPDVRRQVEPLGVEPGAIDILATLRLHADRDDAVAVMVVEKIRENLAAHAVDRVIAL